jgi:hypothetical protein
MLDFNFSTTLADDLWASLSTHAALPTNFREYCRQSQAREVANERRRHHRISCRGRACLARGANLLGVYLLDISPAGIGFYSPMLLFPLEECQITYDQHEAIGVEIRRCARATESCYSCGAIFRDGPMSPSEYNALMKSLRS